jgi:hypothetical protein
VGHHAGREKGKDCCRGIRRGGKNGIGIGNSLPEKGGFFCAFLECMHLYILLELYIVSTLYIHRCIYFVSTLWILGSIYIVSTRDVYIT